MNMQQPPRVAPTGRAASLTTYHVCANAATPEEKKRMPRPCGKKYKAQAKQAKPRNKAIAKKKPTRKFSRKNFIAKPRKPRKQPARAGRPQQRPARVIGPRRKPAQAPVISRAALASMFGG